VVNTLIKIILALFVAFFLAAGIWCEWKGYKDRYPQGGFWGFVTQPGK